MRRLGRSGFSLIELLVAMVVFGIISAAIYGLLTRTQRLSRTQADRAVMQANIRSGIGLITSELREININAAQSDILAADATSITYRAMRGLGFLCEAPTNTQLVVGRAGYVGYRDPIAGRDSVALFVDGDPDSATDDSWIFLRITSLTGGTCASGGAAIVMVIPGLGSTLPSAIPVGSPLRIYEVMQVGQMTQGGSTWLGARTVSGGETSLAPVLGPLAANGVTLRYWNGASPALETSNLLNVRTITMTLRGLTDNIVAAGAGTLAWQQAADSFTTSIRLRNAP